MNDNIKKKKIIIPMFLVLAILVIVGVSYALWQLTFTQTGTNVITTGCLKLTLTEETDAINLVNATPISDEESKKLEPFTFTLENVCTTEADYVVNLETLSTGDKILADSYVKANLVSGENELFIDNLLETYINEEKVIEEATTAYKLHQGKLKSKEKISFNLRLWMDEATEAVDEVMNATWQGKITVTASYVQPVDTKNKMVEMNVYDDDSDNSGYIIYVDNMTYSQDKKYIIDKVVYQSTINPIEEAAEIVDFSEAKDRSILGYYVKNDNSDLNMGSNVYDLYIQANGKIKLSTKASYYGFIMCSGRLVCHEGSALIEGAENWDTSNVTDMSKMFFFGNGTEILDLSGFDTSLVTDMGYMFRFCSSLESLNLSNFYTSRVTIIECMFENCNSLTDLDISNFNTSNVKNMSYIFRDCNNLTNIVYGDNFVYNGNTYIHQMFESCPANKPTGSSWNGVTF